MNLARRLRFWIPPLVGLAALAGTLSLWKNQVKNEEEAARAPTLAALSTAKEEIHSQVESRVAALSHMAKRWEERQKTPRKEWESDAWLFLSQFGDIESLQWIDSDLKARWVVPREQPETSQEQVALFQEARSAALETVQERNQIFVTQPVDLPNGEMGFLVCVPFRTENEFGGVLVGVHHMSEFLQATLGNVAPGYDLALYHGDANFYRRGSDSDWMYVGPHSPDPTAAEAVIRLYGADWRLQASPTPGLFRPEGTLPSSIMLIAGLVVSLLIMLMVYFGYSAQVQAESLKEMNKKMASQVTERNQAQATLREKEDGLRLMTQHFRDALWIRRSGDLSLLYVSPSFEKIWGVTPESVCDDEETWRQAIHEEDRERVTKALSEKGPRGEYDEEYRIQRSDGETRWVRDHMVPIDKGRRDASKIVGIAEDITDRKKAEESLQTVKAELGASDHELESFIRSASDDLREPLRKIMAFGERIDQLAGGKLKGEAKDYLARIHESASSMESLIEDVMSFTRFSAQEQSFGLVSMAAVFTEVLTDLEMSVAESGAQIRVGDLPTLEADQNQMRLLMRNLIGNALKFRKHGESPYVIIESRILKPEETQDISARGRTGFCEMRFEDKGIGFDEKHGEKIFEPFRRLHEREEFPGTGLGLTLCQKIVQRHGGVIRANGKPGEGSTFTVVLPLEQARATEVESRRAA
jgi:PAS domain S-box-containing protein